MKLVNKIKEVKKQDITLYAKWIPNAYTITLNGKGGKYTPAGGEAVSTFKMNLTYDSEAALSTKFVRTGYTLSGFTTKKDGKGKFYAFGEKVKNLTAGKDIIKAIAVPGKLLNIVVKG